MLILSYYPTKITRSNLLLCFFSLRVFLPSHPHCCHLLFFSLHYIILRARWKQKNKSKKQKEKAKAKRKRFKKIILVRFTNYYFNSIFNKSSLKAEFKSLAVTIMGAFFSLTTPMGIVIGILVTNTYKENSSTALIVEGVLNSASAGILIYMALVDLLSPDFMNPRLQKNKMLQLSSNVSLLSGAGLMSLLAKWA